jgi:diguanylate cyclase (GGDEF)-like protein
MLLATWQGDLAAAQAASERAEAWGARLRQSWLGAMISGARAEVALLQDDLPAALTWAHDMQQTADRYGHAAMVMLGHQLLMYLHQLQGDASATLDEARRMVCREQKARCESLKGRARLIEWQLELREKKECVQQLARRSSDFERMALHDALTGLPNRRQFDLRLANCLQGAAPPRLCVALIDVDRFKQINDGYSHSVGDAVLKALATILDGTVRECDLAARLAGDEFVLVLDDAEPALANQVCHRIERAVREHAWGDIAPGLAVSVSVGVCAAQAGDTVDTLLQRSDLHMYRAKRRH